MAVRKSKKGAALKKWFNEEWVDVKTGKPCGRKSATKSKRPYPSCRPKAVAAKMTKAEKASSARRKTGPKAIKHAVTASGRRRKSTRKALIRRNRLTQRTKKCLSRKVDLRIELWKNDENKFILH